MTHLRPGEPTPWFYAPSPSNPRFNFSSVAGRYVLLAFTPSDPERRAVGFAAVERNIDILRDDRIMMFGVLRDPQLFAQARDRNGLRWFADPQGELARLYGAVTPEGEEDPLWVVIDPSLRILFTAPYDDADALFARLRALPLPDDHAGVLLHAPVMIVPRLFDPDLCERLIGYYQTHGGQPSGVMREQNGRTVGVLDDFKKRWDAIIEDKSLQDETREAIRLRLVPEVLKAFRYQATRVERYIVARYDAEDGGYFRPHRDNLTSGTAHREFAVSVNLNGDFDGGDLRFPEYGNRTYRPPPGGAVVFSCSLLHEATPVTRGTRFAFLPFLYDQRGEEVRTRNAHLIKLPGDAPGETTSSDEPAPAEPAEAAQS